MNRGGCLSTVRIAVECYSCAIGRVVSIANRQAKVQSVIEGVVEGAKRSVVMVEGAMEGVIEGAE